MKVQLVWLTAFFAAILPFAAARADSGDAEAGKKVYAQCQACHKLDATGKSTLGPNLYGVVGRKAGTLPGFKYSPAMVAAKRVWTPEALAAYLAAPAKSVPGNRMTFVGLRNESDRKNVIAYLKSASR